MELEERLWNKINWALNEPDRCWPWTGAPSYWGYGQLSFKDASGKQCVGKAHRLAYETFFNEPIRMELDHVCHDPASCEGGRSCPHRLCCNPYHLRDVTRDENHAPNRKNTKAAGKALKERTDPLENSERLRRARLKRWSEPEAREKWSLYMRDRWQRRSPEERRAIGHQIAESKRRKTT